MPVINITSMQGLIDALQSIASYTTLEILNDLDFNDVVSTLTTAISIPTGGSSSNITSDITINGNNHAIYNLDNGAVTSALFQFKYCQNVTIKDLSFLNCHCTKENTRLISSTSSTYTINFNNVVVQGRFYYAPFTYCHFYDSMLTFNYCNNTMGINNTYYTRCWIKFVKCNCRSNTIGMFANADQCYFTGEWGYTNASSSNPLMSGIENCCINVRFTIINSSALVSSTLFRYGGSTTKTSIVNTDKLLFSVSSEMEDLTMVKFVTDEQMKNAEYLAEIGFDIIPT